MQTVMPICMRCRHLSQDKNSFRCLAFPGGIPDEIRYAVVKHTTPYPGDNGIQFAPKVHFNGSAKPNNKQR